MKKLIIVLVLAVIAFATYNRNDIIDYAEKFEAGTVTIYAEEAPSYAGLEVVDNCGIYSVTVTREIARKVYASASGILGVTIRFSGFESEAEGYLKTMKAVEVSRQQLSGTQIIYAYSKNIKEAVLVDGQKVNIEIAIRGGEVRIGVPLILGAY
jgi:hypothetical protein